jgi:hypothetical protein
VSALPGWYLICQKKDGANKQKYRQNESSILACRIIFTTSTVVTLENHFVLHGDMHRWIRRQLTSSSILGRSNVSSAASFKGAAVRDAEKTGLVTKAFEEEAATAKRKAEAWIFMVLLY